MTTKRSKDKEFSSRDFCRGADILHKCRCCHEVDERSEKVKECIFQTHLDVKNQLIQNLEDIIDEQEARIRNMDDFIKGRTRAFNPRNKKILKGISVLSLDFGTLSEENLSLKESLLTSKRTIRLLQLQIAPYKKVIVNVDADCQTNRSADDEGIDVKSEGGGSDKEENNNMLKEDCGSFSSVRSNLDELIQMKSELKKLAMETRHRTVQEFRKMQSSIENILSEYVGSLVIRYRNEVDARSKLHNRLVELNGNIRVFCRIRPSKDGEVNEKSVVRIDAIDSGMVTWETTSGDKKTFNCDRAFSQNHLQSDIFDEVSPIITSCIDGYNVCIFAYGHTGSGKTYTMEGPQDDPGINQRSLAQLFRTAADRSADFRHSISISVLEIYNEKIRDLLSKSKSNLSIRIGDSGALEIPGLTCVEVKNIDDVRTELEKGRHNRVVAVTEVNDRSSRSHAVVRVTVRSHNLVTDAVTEGRLNLVDLAGSERVSQSGATGQLLREAQSINRSLSELGNVMTALRQRHSHIPFRNCQLTRLLEDCLNGDSKTLMIVQLAPGQQNMPETLSSLNFADKVSKVQTKRTSSPNYGSLTSPIKTNRSSVQNTFVRSYSVRGAKK